MKNREYNKKDLLINKRSDFSTRRLYSILWQNARVTTKKYKVERYEK